MDPDTGLIYFKYDFGYEFGIILPGEGKQGEIPVPKKTIIEPPKRSTDIEMPVYHETSKKDTQFRPKKFTPSSKNVKWEPTSESEMSEYEGESRKRGSTLHASRWDPSSCSPVSLSPSLPSTSPAFNSTIAGTWCARLAFFALLYLCENYLNVCIYCLCVCLQRVERELRLRLAALALLEVPMAKICKMLALLCL